MSHRIRIFDHDECHAIGEVHSPLPEEVEEVMNEHGFSLMPFNTEPQYTD